MNQDESDATIALLWRMTVTIALYSGARFYFPGAAWLVMWSLVIVTLCEFLGGYVLFWGRRK